LLKAASLALVLAVALPAIAQVLYKWVDDNGKTQYSDKPPPKNFKGTVTAIDTEPDKTTLPPSPPRAQPAIQPAAGAAKPVTTVPTQDLAAKRRATRAKLEARLIKARENVDVARKALKDSESPEVDERQVVQQRAATGGMHGMAGRSNCRWETNGAQKYLMCPTSVPTSEYHDRVAGLEENLRKAESELAAAEEAWRGRD
jgi:hypothetical protein